MQFPNFSTHFIILKVNLQVTEMLACTAVVVEVGGGGWGGGETVRTKKVSSISNLCRDST